MPAPNPALDRRMARRGFVSVLQASRRTAISTTALYDAVKSGTIAHEKVGARIYLDLRSLLAHARMTEDEWAETEEAQASPESGSTSDR